MSTETRLKETEDYEKKKESAEMFEDFCSCVMTVSYTHLTLPTE